MENYFIFDEQELVRIGVVCPDCNTESVFDLTKDQTAIRPRTCPGCEAEILSVQVSKDRYEYNAITAYKRLLDSDKKPRLLFYFKKP